jgi:hypothetical protein
MNRQGMRGLHAELGIKCPKICDQGETDQWAAGGVGLTDRSIL